MAKSGGLNHIATVLSELIESIDSDKLLTLAKSSAEVAWVQKLGYILEKLEPTSDNIAKTVIDKLAEYLSAGRKRYIPLANEIGTEGFPRSKKWHIIENTTIESDI